MSPRSRAMKDEIMKEDIPMKKMPKGMPMEKKQMMTKMGDMMAQMSKMMKSM